MAVFSFDANELEGIAPVLAQEQYLKKFGFVAPPLPQGYSHLAPVPVTTQAQKQERFTPPSSPSRTDQRNAHAHEHTGFGTTQTAMPVNGGGAGDGGEQINTLVAKRNKKRVQPRFVGAVPSAANVPSAGSSAGPSANAIQARSTFGEGHRPPSSSSMPMSMSMSNSGPSNMDVIMNGTSRHAPLSMSFTDDGFGFGVKEQERDQDFVMGGDDMDVHISALGGPSGTANRGKRKALEGVDDRTTSKPRTLGGDRQRDTASLVAREISSASDAMVGPSGWTGPGWGLEGRLEVPRLLTYLKVAVEGSEDIFEGRNAEDDGKLI